MIIKLVSPFVHIEMIEVSVPIKLRVTALWAHEVGSPRPGRGAAGSLGADAERCGARLNFPTRPPALPRSRPGAPSQSIACTANCVIMRPHRPWHCAWLGGRGAIGEMPRSLPHASANQAHSQAATQIAHPTPHASLTQMLTCRRAVSPQIPAKPSRVGVTEFASLDATQEVTLHCKCIRNIQVRSRTHPFPRED